MSVKDIIATIPKTVSQQEENFDLQQILQSVPKEGYDCKGIYYKKIPLGAGKNHSLKKVDNLLFLFTVTFNNKKDTAAYWLCLCNCGNLIVKRGSYASSKFFCSCGCTRGDHSYGAKDLTGQRFSRLLVLKRNKKYQKENNLKSKGYWDCLCDCGRIVTIHTRNLIKGTTKSCGCYLNDKIRTTKLNDLTNKKFNHLLVLELDEEAMKNRVSSHTGAIWKCLCDCGNIISVRASNLTDGVTNSCGCTKSRSIGEDKIYRILEQNKINFLFDSSFFKDLFINTKIGRYDFIIFNKESRPIRLIEYDGEAHYEETNFYVSSLEEIKKKDEIKNQYAKKHNLPLVRIPYWERENITYEMLMGDKYLIT